jgi:uncharacterized LabA/DUF88 family protein
LINSTYLYIYYGQSNDNIFIHYFPHDFNLTLQEVDIMEFIKTERTAIFIDGSNLYAAARALGFDIDYRRLLEIFREQTRVVRAFYYTALIEDQEYSPIRPLVDWLDYNGYTMVTKPTKEFTDSMGRRKIKGNMDIEIAVDAIEMAEHLDHIVLFSGDGDFRRMVEAVQRKGLRVTVVSTVRSQPPMIADELRRQADVFIDLVDLQPEIGRKGARPMPVQHHGVDEDMAPHSTPADAELPDTETINS